MSRSHEIHKQHAFDSFCKKVLKNETRDHYDEENRQRDHEISLSELSSHDIDKFLVNDDYPSEIFSFSVLEFEVVIRDGRIGEAVAALPKHKRDIILLYYLLGLKDREISKKLNLVCNTVQYRRTSSLRELKKYMEGKR